MSIQKEAKELLHFLHKKWNYSRDLLNTKDLQKVVKLKTNLKQAANGDLLEQDAKKLIEQSPRQFEKFWPGCTKSNPWMENIEVLFVALVIAFALRCYFVQPFKIPTDSMKPTLWGIYREPSNEPKPNIFKQVIDYSWLGKSYHNLKAKNDGAIESINPGRSILFIGTTIIRFAGEDYTIFTDYENVIKSMAMQHKIPIAREDGLNEMAHKLTGLRISAGQDIANFSVLAGDHIFVDKLSYNFRLPQQGEVFVFTTKDIVGLSNSTKGITQYYIKRCVGVPGVTLRIDEPYLYSNGQILDHRKALENIYSKQNGYNGYVWAPNSYMATANDEVYIPEDKFWAMGDNSANSLDSRYWHYVPRSNLVGTAFITYWPFTKRWGLIK